jgi:hypothetical protein
MPPTSEKAYEVRRELKPGINVSVKLTNERTETWKSPP